MSLDFRPASPLEPTPSIANLRAHAAELRARLSASVNHLGNSQRAVQQSYTMLADVGARYANAQARTSSLSVAISPSVARAYMVARRLSSHAAEQANDASRPA